jgi:glyoxylase-like metal-dependent hydrolase (beta-lactamase superfamily II)
MPDTSLPEASILDLNFLGYSEAIASCLLEGGGELALVDSGPTSCLPTLRAKLAERGLQVADLTAILLTHIHFDHAGAAGTLIRENPDLKVYVHSIGAKHMVNPERLLASATRLYGDAMQQMFGEFLAVPAENLAVLEGGERLQVAGRKVEVAYTPGHASHHVTFLDLSTGTAFVGDTTGLRLPGHGLVAPVTPPPDIDLEVWDRSLDEISRRDPALVFLTHFGPYKNVEEHLDQTREGLHRWADRAAEIMAATADNGARIARFVQESEAEIHRALPAETAARYTKGANATLSWYGLERYWRKRAKSQS